MITRLRNRTSYTLTLIERVTQASYSELFSTWIGSNILFAIFYFLLATEAPAQAPTQLAAIPNAGLRFFNALYFSLITATSTGYGDIVPMGFSKVLAAIQCIFALLVFAVFVTKLVSRHQDAAMEDIHRLAFEGIFNDVRQGLLIARMDVDRVIREVERSGSIAPQDWENLSSTYVFAQSLLEEIPGFYDARSDAYTFERRREQIFMDATWRLLRRMNRLLEALKAANIDWKTHQESADQLVTFIHAVDEAVTVWEKVSPHHTIDHFQEILGYQRSLHEAVAERDGQRG